MELLQGIEIDLVSIAMRLLLVVVVFIVGRFLAGLLRRWVERSLRKTDLTDSLIVLITTVTYYTILLITVLIVLALLGVPAAALAGTVSVIVIVLAITLQSSLGNLAATINFLLFKPFEVGDLMETAGVMGFVQEIQVFSTVIISPNRKTHVLPNSKIQNAGLANYSKTGTMRVDLSFGISYDSDVDKAKQIIQDILTEHDSVLAEPPPQVFLQKLSDSTLDIAAWPFVRLADFLPFQSDIVQRVKNSFDEAGIVIPYPQQDVHLVKEN
ncbi:MAG: mechanosensitive ion channel [Chloroflexi bacterium]|jgi:small conductance mechanosensitive channel|nr:mechanosensitive ion channel [Chloroflexota bacterium]